MPQEEGLSLASVKGDAAGLRWPCNQDLILSIALTSNRVLRREYENDTIAKRHDLRTLHGRSFMEAPRRVGVPRVEAEGSEVATLLHPSHGLVDYLRGFVYHLNPRGPRAHTLEAFGRGAEQAAEGAGKV